MRPRRVPAMAGNHLLYAAFQLGHLQRHAFFEAARGGIGQSALLRGHWCGGAAAVFTVCFTRRRLPCEGLLGGGLVFVIVHWRRRRVLQDMLQRLSKADAQDAEYRRCRVQQMLGAADAEYSRSRVKWTQSKVGVQQMLSAADAEYSGRRESGRIVEVRIIFRVMGIEKEAT